MTVFRGFLKLVRSNLNVLILYLAIFLTICIAIQLLTKGESVENFQEESLNIAVIDRDGGSLAKALTSYLGTHHHLVEIQDDPDVIQEKLFYRNIYYAVVIPGGFEEKCLEQGEKLPVTKIPGAYSAYYVDQQINSFLNDVRILKAAGYKGKEIYEKAGEFQKAESKVELMDKNGYGGEPAPHAFMFQYMPYIMISVICYMISYIMIGFRQKEVRLRMQCAAMAPVKQNAQLILGCLVLGVLVWGICMLMPVLLYGKDFLNDSNMPFYLLNAFAMVLVSLAIAFTMGTLVRKTEIVSGIVNVISLGMSFTCGVFVSMEVLGKGVKAFAHFLPVYWYEIVNQILAENVDFTSGQKMGIFQGVGIQILFAAAIVCAGLVIDRRLRE